MAALMTGGHPLAGPHLRELIPAAQIQARLLRLGSRIAREYVGQCPLLVGILDGCLPFLADLIRVTPLDLEYTCLRISSYAGALQPISAPRLLEAFPPERVAGRHLLVVEDILDSGATLTFIREYLQPLEPASLRFCVLAVKTRPRPLECPLPEFTGFDVPDEFVVGYGLDYQGHYRNLPGIATLDPARLLTTEGAG